MTRHNDIIEEELIGPTKIDENEEWKPINYPDCNKMHVLSNYGRLYSHATGTYLSTKSLRSGYKSTWITLTDGKQKNIKVHRLVALTFLPKPDSDKKLYVNHKDGNKLNNHASNLEWATIKENNNHAIKMGLMKVTKRKVQQLDMDGNLIKEFDTIKSAEVETGISSAGIVKVCKESRNMAGGFRWKFSDENPNEQRNVDLTNFKPINNFPKYRISRTGEVYSVPYKKFLKTQNNGDGYICISLVHNNNKKSFLLHRLVAEHFLEPSDKSNVRFKDKDKKNINADNLEYY